MSLEAGDASAQPPSAPWVNGAAPDALGYRPLFEATPNLYLVLHPDAPRFTIADATAAYCRATLTVREEIIGRGLFEVFPDANPENPAPTGVPNLRASLEAVLHTGAPHRMEVQRYDPRRPDGSWEMRYWAPLNAPVRGPDGEVRYILHHVEDVTERVLQREAVEAAERRTARILERMSDAVFTFDSEWRYTSFNPAGREMVRHVGGDPDALLGRVIWQAFPALVGTPFERGLREAVTAGRAVRVELGYPDAAGQTLVAEGDAVSTGDGVALYLRDVSAYRRLLAAERDARAEAEAARLAAERAGREADEANQAKSAFLATMSHEIRTPINAQIGYAQLMELGIAGPVTEQQREYLVRLAATSEHLRGLVDDVLDLAKIDAGRMAVAQEPGLTGAHVATALDLVRPQASARGVRLVDARPGEPGVPFVGDEHRVRQILVNLLSNAVKFTEPGGTVTVTCGLQHETPPGTELRGGGPWAFVRVHDTGVGIPPVEQTRIFEPFHQVDAGHTRQQGGTGLGLAISRRLARLMGGDLTVESTPAVGSAFTLWLPAADATPDRAESAGERGARARREPGAGRMDGLAEIGMHLRERIEDVIAAYAARLRADPAFPQAAHLRRSELEDHQLSFLADVAQTLVVIEETGGPESDLLRDGSTIQRAVAELHGAMRQRRGWTDAQLVHEYAILGEEIAAVVRRRVPEGAGDLALALGVLGRLVERARATGLAALRRAAEGGDG
jgi:signal transduction histidine kinase